MLHAPWNNLFGGSQTFCVKKRTMTCLVCVWMKRQVTGSNGSSANIGHKDLSKRGQGQTQGAGTLSGDADIIATKVVPPPIVCKDCFLVRALSDALRNLAIGVFPHF